MRTFVGFASLPESSTTFASHPLSLPESPPLLVYCTRHQRIKVFLRFFSATQTINSKSTELLVCESSKITSIWRNPHQIFRRLDVGLCEQNNSPLWTSKLNRINCNGLHFWKLQSQIFDRSKQIHSVDIQFQSKIKDNLPWCLKVG